MSSVARRLVAIAVLAVLLAVSMVPVWAQTPACRFVLGFAALRDLVGAEKVGACLEDEHFNPANGNAEQRTSGGLLVWRKIDNFTAFTDGATSWINGPNGLQSRPNGERFAWERDPVSPSGAPASAPPSVAASPSPLPAGSPATAPTGRPPAIAVGPTATPSEQVIMTDGPCDPSYPDFCIPPPPPDLNCDSPVIDGRKNFRVLSPDPHRLDQNGNGVACESSGR